jgi:hypothetical protein
MDDHLASYIINYYSHLLTPEERAAQHNVLCTWKMEHATSPEIKREWAARVTTDPNVVALLADGIAAFHERLCERVLRERLDELFLNCCPRCGALTKTPTAKQCSKCYLSWHDDV